MTFKSHTYDKYLSQFVETHHSIYNQPSLYHCQQQNHICKFFYPRWRMFCVCVFVYQNVPYTKINIVRFHKMKNFWFVKASIHINYKDFSYKVSISHISYPPLCYSFYLNFLLFLFTWIFILNNAAKKKKGKRVRWLALEKNVKWF